MTDCYVLPLINSLIRARPKSPVTVISDVIARKMSGMCAAGSQPTTQTDRQTCRHTHNYISVLVSNSPWRVRLTPVLEQRFKVTWNSKKV